LARAARGQRSRHRTTRATSAVSLSVRPARLRADACSCARASRAPRMEHEGYHVHAGQRRVRARALADTGQYRAPHALVSAVRCLSQPGPARADKAAGAGRERRGPRCLLLCVRLCVSRGFCSRSGRFRRRTFRPAGYRCAERTGRLRRRLALFSFPLLYLTVHSVIVPCDCNTKLNRCIIDNVRPLVRSPAVTDTARRSSNLCLSIRSRPGRA
jgi:hypothetical protein